MYWHQGCVNTATVSIQTEGARVGIHVWEGANTYFRNKSSKIFSCICASANTGPTCIRANINFPRFFSCMYWFCARGNNMSEPIFGKGMRRSAFQLKTGVFSEKGEAIQWRGPVHSVNCRTLKTEKLLSSSPSRNSALNMPPIFPSNTLHLITSNKNAADLIYDVFSLQPAHFRQTPLPSP